ncbi:MAG: serine/threonine-protein kinase [Pseudomonadota bacterium]
MNDLTQIVPGGAPPRVIGKYRIDGILGQGAMGLVYLGYDPDIDRPVAIKTVHAHLISDAERDSWLDRFAREAKAAGRCIHANLVTIFDYLQEGGQPFIVMERIESRTLEDRLKTGPGLQLAEIRSIFLQLLAGLEAIHAAGIIHRDLKPANVMLTDDGVVKLTDFGVARIQSMDATGAAMIGTPSYMSPEQFLGRPTDRRSDVFAAGAMLYEMLTGAKPFRATGMEEMIARISDGISEPPSTYASGLPEGLDDAVLKALASDPEERFEDVSAFRDAFFAVFGTAPDLNASHIERVAPPGAPRGSESETMIRRMSPQTFARIEAQLVARVGPIGRILMKRAASTTSDAHKMLDLLLSELEEAEGETLRASILKELSGAVGGSTNIFTASVLSDLAERLTPHVGPIAPVLVRREAQKAESLEELYSRIAAHIVDARERKGFLAGLT